jgi:hypothetical protein
VDSTNSAENCLKTLITLSRSKQWLCGEGLQISSRISWNLKTRGKNVCLGTELGLREAWKHESDRGFDTREACFYWYQQICQSIPNLYINLLWLNFCLSPRYWTQRTELYLHIDCNGEKLTHDVIPHFLKTAAHAKPLKTVSTQPTVIKIAASKEQNLEVFLLVSMLQVQSSQDLCRRQKVPSLGFSETAEAAFKCGPPGLQKFSTVGR